MKSTLSASAVPSPSPREVEDFIYLGLGDYVYIVPTHERGYREFAIHAADGQRVIALATREAAVHKAQTEDFVPMSAH